MIAALLAAAAVHAAPVDRPCVQGGSLGPGESCSVSWSTDSSSGGDGGNAWTAGEVVSSQPNVSVRVNGQTMECAPSGAVATAPCFVVTGGPGRSCVSRATMTTARQTEAMFFKFAAGSWNAAASLYRTHRGSEADTNAGLAKNEVGSARAIAALADSVGICGQP